MRERMREWVTVAKQDGWLLLKNLGQRNAWAVRAEGTGVPDYQKGVGRKQAVETFRAQVLKAQKLKARKLEEV